MPTQLEPIKGVAFDLDGTLVDSAPDLVAAAQQVLRVLDSPQLSAERIVSFIGGGVELLVERTVTASLKQAPAPDLLATATRTFRDHYAAHLYDRSSVYPGVRETLERLRARGIRCCCVTNKAVEFAEPLLVAADLDSLLEFTLTPTLPAERKPGPLMLQQTCARWGLRPAELLMVGDSHADLGAAQAASCPVLLVRYGYGSDLAATRPTGFIDAIAEVEAWIRSD